MALTPLFIQLLAATLGVAIHSAVFGADSTSVSLEITHAPADAAVRGSGRLRLLLAEDNVVNQALAAGLLKRDGHDVTIVGNGVAAVAAATAGHFDAIFMDVQMPEMNGLDASAAIRAHGRAMGAHPWIIAMTAHAMQGDRERCLAAGMDDYVSKPIRPQDLRRAIAAIGQPCVEPSAVGRSTAPVH